MRKKYKPALIAACILLLGCAVWYVVWGIVPSDFQPYRETWHVVLPDSVQRQCYESNQSFAGQGDGNSCAVYRWNDSNPPQDFSFFSGASSRKNKDVERKVTQILSLLKVDSKFRPDFSGPYEWKILSRNEGFWKLYLLYDPNSSLLYCVEDII